MIRRQIILSLITVCSVIGSLSAQCTFTAIHANSDDHCLYAIEDVVWSKTGFSATLTRSTNNLTRSGGTAGWNAGAVSVNTVKNNGWASTIIAASETNTERVFGLSITDGGVDNNSIKYGFFLRADGTLDVIESGATKTSIGGYAGGKELRIAVENSVVKYYYDSQLKWVSSVAYTTPLIVDVSLKTIGATLKSVTVANGSDGSFALSAPAADYGAAPTYKWILDSNTGSPVSTSATYTNTALNASNTLYCEITPGAGGCSAGAVTTNMIRFSMESPSRIGDYYISNTAAVYACLDAREDVIKFVNKTNVSVSGNTVTKNYGGGSVDAGASSAVKVYNNGYAETTIIENDKGRYFGLSSSDPDVNVNSLQYAFYFRPDHSAEIYQSGSKVSGTSAYNYQTGDVFRIAIEDGVVKYYQNGGTPLYISSVTPTLPMVVDMSFQDKTATLSNIRIGNGSTAVFTANASLTGSSPSYQWWVDATPAGTGPSLSYPTLTGGQTVSCTINPDRVGCTFTTPQIVMTSRNYGGTFYINSNPSSIACAVTTEEVMFASKTNVIATGNSLRKSQGGSGSYNAGAVSLNLIQDNGYAEMTVTETDKGRVFGVSTAPSSRPLTATAVDRNSIQYAVELGSNNQLYIWDIDGSNNPRFLGNPQPYQAGDVIGFVVDNGTVKSYRRSGGVTYPLQTYGIAPTLPLVVDVTMYNENSTFTNVVVSNGATGEFVANAPNAGASPFYQWKVGAMDQFVNAPTFSSSTLVLNDEVTCIMTPDIAGCSTGQTSNKIKVTIMGGATSPTTTWTGGTASWETASNWSNGRPTGYHKVIIPSGSPTINQSTGVYDITVNSGATLNMNGSVDLTVFDKWENSGSFVPSTSTVKLRNCTNNKNSIIAANPETFNKLDVDNKYGVDVTGDHAIATSATLTNGILKASTGADLIIFNDGATVTGASNASFVDGPVRKIGDDIFTFPVGNVSQYRRLSITAPTSVTDYFTARYWRAPQAYGGPSTWQSSIWHISGCEYWTLTRSGSSAPTVTLSWDGSPTGCPSPPYISDLSSLIVTYWNGTGWKDAGNGGTTGDATAGTIKNLVAITDYNAFALGTTTANNSLPITLNDFTATVVSPGVQLEWETLTESNSEAFIVERAGSDFKFEPIGRVEATGESRARIRYQYLDPLNGSGYWYYRLKMLDIDGTFTHSPVQSVLLTGDAKLGVYPNPVKRGDELTLWGHAGHVRIVDVYTNKIVLEATNAETLDTTPLKAGVYLVCFDSGANVRLVVM